MSKWERREFSSQLAALHLNWSNNGQWDTNAVKNFKKTFPLFPIAHVRWSTALALIKPSYRWNTTFSFILFFWGGYKVAFFFSIGVDDISEGNQTNLSFSVSRALNLMHAKALQTPRCYTGARYKFWPHGTSGSPGSIGPFAPSVLPDPSPSRFKETTHLHPWPRKG